MKTQCRQSGCDGKITTGKQGVRFFREGARYKCLKCKVEYLCWSTKEFELDEGNNFVMVTQAKDPEKYNIGPTIIRKVTTV